MAQPSRFGEMQEDLIEILSDDDIVEDSDAGSVTHALSFTWTIFTDRHCVRQEDRDPATGRNAKDIKGKRTTSDAEDSIAAQDEVSETLQDIRRTRDDLLGVFDSLTSNVTELVDATNKLREYLGFFESWVQEASEEMGYNGFLWAGIPAPPTFDQVVNKFRPSNDSRAFNRVVSLMVKALLYSLLSVMKDSVPDLALILNLSCNLASDIESQDLDKINQVLKAIGSTLKFPTTNEGEAFEIECMVRRKEEAALKRFRPKVNALLLAVRSRLRQLSESISTALEKSSDDWRIIMERVSAADSDQLQLSQVEAMCKRIFDPNNIQMMDYSAFLEEMTKIYNGALAQMAVPVITQRQSLHRILSRLESLGNEQYGPTSHRTDSASVNHEQGTGNLSLPDDLVKYGNIVEDSMTQIVPDETKRVCERQPAPKRQMVSPREDHDAKDREEEEKKPATEVRTVGTTGKP